MLLVLWRVNSDTYLDAEVNRNCVALLDVEFIEAFIHVGFYWSVMFSIFTSWRKIVVFGSTVDLMAKLTLEKPGCHNWFEMGYSDLNSLNWGTLGDSEHWIWISYDMNTYENIWISSEASGFSVSMTSVAVTCRHSKKLQKILLFFVLLMKDIDLMIKR